MTTLEGGQTFNYLDADGGVVRIRLVGNITAEFTAARVRESNNTVVIRDLIQAPPPGTPNAPSTGADLFNIYIAKADSNAQIIITKVPTSIAADTLATPYTGSVGTVRAPDGEPLTIDPDTGDVTGATTTITPDATGDVWIGARTRDLDFVDGSDEADIPIIYNRTRAALGVRPAAKGLFAGIYTAPGVDMGKVMIGGTVTGIVNFQGSLRTFYAGNVLTGNISGLTSGFGSGASGVGSSPIHNNFQVGGDLQNLYILGSFGTTAAGNFQSGLEARIGGRLGNVHIGGSHSGAISVIASPTAPALDLPIQEEETWTGGNASIRFLRGSLSGAAVSNNVESSAAFGYATGTSQGISWAGTLAGSTAGDGIDNYALPLLAGQTVTLELQSTFGGVQLGVYDPLGRLIASESPGTTGAAVGNQFQITTKIPGIYRLAVVSSVDNTYSGGGIGGDTYTLNATNVGNLTFGGASVSGVTRLREAGKGIAVRTGDLGAWYGLGDVTGTAAIYSAAGAASAFAVSRGNLRAIYGNNVGIVSTALVEYLPLYVPRGSVGYINAAAMVALNADAAYDTNDPVPTEAIGGDYQRVEAGGDLQGNLVANGNIGTIIAGSIYAATALGSQPTISTNTDGVGDDGNIDMIYVSGNVGSTAGGGPAIFVGRGGNLKYFYVQGSVFRDTFYGSTFGSTNTYPAGRSVRLTDDSGAVAVITPTASVSATTPVTDPVTGAAVIDPLTGLPATTPVQGALTLTTYPVRTGGVVLVSADSTTNMTVTTLAGTPGSFDIGEFTTADSGSAVVTNTTTDATTGLVTGTEVGYTPPTTTTPTTPTTGTTLTQTPQVVNNIVLGGSLPVNVFHITGNNVTNLINSTNGEVVSANLASLGILSVRTIGRIEKNTVTDVITPTNIVLNNANNALIDSPFDPYARGLDVSGSVIGLSPRDGIGNVQVGDTIGVIQPNSDQKNAKGKFDGIDGVVEANVFNVINIGEGVAYQGSGGVFQAGIFADTRINAIGGDGADIRAPVVSKGTFGTMTLNDGSVIGTTIGSVGGSGIEGDFTGSGFTSALFTSGAYLLPETAEAFSVENINLTGNGGLLGTYVVGGSIGSVAVEGYGIIDSAILANGTLRANGSITAGGLGIRVATIDVGSSINSISATGDGRVLDVSQYPSTVLQSSNGRRRFDAYTGRLLNGTNDLNRFLGTSTTRPKISGVTNSGVLQDVAITGNGNLNSLNAYAITSTDLDTAISSSAFPMRIAMGNTIGSINVDNGISGLQVRTGTLKELNVGGNVARTSIVTSGDIGDINVGRTVRSTASITALGSDSFIDSVIVRGSLLGILQSDAGIGLIAAANIGANIATSGGIGKVAITEDLLQDATIRARKAIDQVVIGGDIQEGAKIDARSIGKFRLGGTNNGTVTTKA